MRRRNVSKRAVVGLAMLTLVALAAVDLIAFEMGIHETLTSDVLTTLGFDRDTADDIGASNSLTDLSEPTTAAAHADNNELGAASARLREKRTRIGDHLNACRRSEALDTLGEALHTVQDVYSHSNSVDNAIPIPDLLSMSNGTAACAPPEFAPGGLVTGYFSLFGWLTGDQCEGIGPGECCHRDLNKDGPEVPNKVNHDAALAAARTATSTYVGLVESDIRSRFPAADAAKFLKMLKQDQRTEIFVIDDTGSMSEDIAGVKTTVNQFLDEMVAGDEAPTLGLVTFKDSVDDRGLMCNVEDLRSQINALSASGGGDCPEASNQAMLAALARIPIVLPDVQERSARIVVATDASPNAPGLGPAVAALAAVRGVSIDAILSGDCVAEGSAAEGSAWPARVSSNDPTSQGDALPAVAPATDDPLTSPSGRAQFRALTELTGGVLFNVEHIEVEDVVPLLLELGDPEAALLMSRRIDLPSGAPVELAVTVDDEIGEKITFMVTASQAGILPSVSVLRPDGSPVAPGDPDVEVVSLSSVITHSISNPVHGTWKIRLEGKGRFHFRAFGGTPFRLNGLLLQRPEEGGRPEVDLMPIDGQPVAGERIFGDLRFTDRPQNLRVFLRRPDGSLLTELAPALLDAGRRYRIEITVPGETFVVESAGLTPGGQPFVRQIAVPVNPQLVSLRATPSQIEAPPASTVKVDVTVQNVSTSEATFRLTASGTQGWPISLPPVFTLAPGASTTLAVDVSVPADVSPGVRNDLTLLVENVAVPQIRNSAPVTVLVTESGADLKMAISESGDPVVAGSGSGNLTYTVTVTNDGPSEVTNVRILQQMTLPLGVSVASIVPGEGTTFSGSFWSMESLAAGGSRTLTVHLTVSAAAMAGIDTIRYTATIIGADGILLNLQDDSATESTSIAPPGGTAAEIPTVSEWGLLLLMLLLTGLSIYKLRSAGLGRRG